MNAKVLEGKTAIVTGAAHGIGRTIAEVFAAEGAWVLVADLNLQAASEVVAGIERAGGKATACKCDVSSREQVAEAVALAAKHNGRIDVLVNNAAYIGTWHAAEEATEEEWEKCMRVSLMGTQYFTQACLPLMRALKNGSVIVISSVQGMVGARNSVAYTTVKSGLLGFARSIAYDYGPENIRANVICPGPIRTRISPEPGTELHSRQISKTMLGRTGETTDIAYACLFLASDQASYITGAVIPVDGGWTAI